MLLLVQLFQLVLDHLQIQNSYFVFHRGNRLHHDDFEVYYSEHWTSKTEHRQLYIMVSELNQVTNTDRLPKLSLRTEGFLELWLMISHSYLRNALGLKINSFVLEFLKNFLDFAMINFVQTSLEDQSGEPKDNIIKPEQVFFCKTRMGPPSYHNSVHFL